MAEQMTNDRRQRSLSNRYEPGGPIPRVLFSAPKPSPELECHVVYAFYDGVHVATLGADSPADNDTWSCLWMAPSVRPVPTVGGPLQDLEEEVRVTIAHQDGWYRGGGAGPEWSDDGWFDPSRLPDHRKTPEYLQAERAGRTKEWEPGDVIHWDDGRLAGITLDPERAKRADRNLGQVFLEVAAEIDRDRSAARSPESLGEPGSRLDRDPSP